MTDASKPRVAIVVPCHIPLSEAWVAALKAEADAYGAQVVIVDDSDGKLGDLPSNWDILDYKIQEEFLGELYEDFARLFHKNSACRVVGHIWAYAQGYDVVLGLDSDCIVKTHFIRDHLLLVGKDYGCDWFNPIGHPFYSRGFPYSKRNWEVVANMGLWENVLDINGADRKDYEPKDIKLAGTTIPAAHFPFSGMNFSLAKKAIPFFLFIPNFDNGDGAKFRRVDDIWGGYIFQKFMREKKWSASVGYPVVYHDTVVVPEEDAADEKAMYDHEDEFIKAVDRSFAGFSSEEWSTIGEGWAAFLSEFNVFSSDRIEPMRYAIKWWVRVCDKYFTE